MSDDEDKMERMHILVEGRVQGVWFRASTRDQGNELGLSGFVRNLPDGRVEVIAEGDRPQLEALLAYCRQGPKHAVVEHVDTEWLPARGGLGASFQVRY